jgi:predicted neuraminidase
MVTLENGEWLMVFNDQEEGRFNLTAAISDDEGKSWKWRKAIEDDADSQKPAASHYPSVIEGDGGRIHVVYSYHRNDTTPGKTIKYTSFPVQWVKDKSER